MNPTKAAELLHKHRSDSEIAKLVDSTQSSINKIRRGLMTPTWPVGQKLVALARKPQK